MVVQSKFMISPSKTVRKRRKVSNVWDSVQTISEEGKTYLQCILPDCLWKYDVTSYTTTKKPIPTTIIHRHLGEHNENFEFETTENSPCLFDSEEKQKYQDLKLLQLCVVDYRPLFMVTTPSFKEYSSGLNSNYVVPGRHKLASLMHKTVLFVQDVMVKDFLEIPVFSSSTDCWNSKKGTHFLNIIVYRIES